MLSVVLALALSAPLTDAEAKPWHRAVGLFQYLEGDYPAAIAAQEPTEIDEQKAFAREAVSAVEALGAPGAPFLERARALSANVDKQAAPDLVSKEAGALARELVQLSGLSRAPRHAPDLARGAAVFAQNCQVCHGPNGDGDTATGKALKPPAASFHDEARMAALTPYKAFNTTAFGVLGTAMAPFPALSEDDRWAVAFYLFTFRQKPCDGKPPAAGLDALATKTDSELAATFGADSVACLRRKLPQPDQGQSLARAREGVERAQRAYAAKDLNGARQEIIDAYLEGVEPIEPLLKAREPQSVRDLEAAFGDARTALQENTGFEAATTRLLGVIAHTDGRAGESKGTFWSVFITAALILLREGFEAMVVVAALLAVLKKLGATSHANTVHAGWASALVAGAVLYIFGQELIAGARRELLETVVSLAAVAMLLYAALWLNARSNISAHMGELREKMQSALGKQSAWGLFIISFSSVLRETAETALFLQGLATDSQSGTVWGALAGLVALGAFVIFVSRAGFRLPMKALFNGSTVLLVATSIVLLGKGMHGLQELGILSLKPIPFFDVPTLGLFPDAWPTVPQALLLAAVLGYWAYSRRPRGLPAVSTES
jgi:high-affinity iron transporter